MTSYYRICQSLNDKGILVPEGTNLDKYKNGEAYVSVYKYSQEQYDQFKKSGTVAGITDVKSDTLYFDFDCSDLEQSRASAIELVTRLKNKGIPEDNIPVCFSGAKGYHVELHLTTEHSPEELKALATNLAGDLKGFDSVIYNSNRIMRIEGSVHKTSKLRKTRISFEELKSLQTTEIKVLAKDLYDYNKPPKTVLPFYFLELMKPVLKQSDGLLTRLEYGIDYSKNPLNLQPWKLAISQGLFPDGQRSNSLMILAATLRAKGFDETSCYYQLKASADLQSQKHGSTKFSKKEIYDNIIDQVYGNNWQGKQYSEDNFPVQLQQYFEELGVPRKEYKDVANDVVSIADKFDDVTAYFQDIDKHTIRFGTPTFDKNLRICKGHMVGLIGSPGSGKTSMAITFINNTSKEGIRSYFGSYDMYSLNVYQKLIQRHTGLTDDQLYDVFKKKDIKKIEEFRQILIDNYENVSFCFKSGQTVQELKKSLEMEEEKLGQKIELVVVDYLELVKTERSDPTQSSMEAIQGLREIANDGRVVLVLLQPNKMSSKVNEPMLSYNAAKGSSSIAQACTAIIGCWREGQSPNTPEDDEFFSMNILKNRNGPLSSMDFYWNGKTQTISELDDDGRFKLRDLRDRKEEEASDKKDGDKYGGI